MQQNFASGDFHLYGLHGENRSIIQMLRKKVWRFHLLMPPSDPPESGIVITTNKYERACLHTLTSHVCTLISDFPIFGWVAATATTSEQGLDA